MLRNKRLCASRAGAPTISLLSARSGRLSKRLAYAAQCATYWATQHVTAHNWPQKQKSVALPTLAKQITTVLFSTEGVPVFVATSANTSTPVPTVTGVIPSGSALGRPADPPPITSHAPRTPLRPQIFARFLSNKAFVSELTQSLTYGFSIGYTGPRTPLTTPNLRSALEHPQVVDEALHKEVAEQRMAGPYTTPPYPNLRCSGLGVVPKKDGTWRLINHLSAPLGNSINDYIDPLDYSLQYSTIDDAISICHTLGRGALMAKVDLKHAFRLCPVRRQDWHLLGIHWRGQYYVDKCLPFGLRSAPYLFNMVAEALQWILREYFTVQHSFHYLDDFFFAGPADSPTCLRALEDMLLLCSAVQAPLKPEKVLGPSPVLVILGIELDTVQMQARLPEEKLTTLLEELHAFSLLPSSNHTCTKRQLLSLIGKLAFACKVIPAGRIFLRRLLDLAHSRDELDVPFALGDEAMKDILWWLKFGRSWNGTAFFLDPTWTPTHEFHLFTDASGTLGYGAYWNGAWFSQAWPPQFSAKPIEWKELFAIVMAAETWGSHWSGKRLLFHCDNQAIVQIWQSSLSRCSDLMHLVRALFFIAAQHNFNVIIRHIPGIDNSIADSLSRLQISRFRSLAPKADPLPTPTPANLTFS